MTYSMTGFASLAGAHAPWSWSWDIRSVNGKGLEQRLRLPDWVPGLEPAVRKAVGEAVARGNVSVNLRVNRAAEDALTRLNPVALDAALGALSEITRAAEARGMELTPATAPEIAAMRGVLEAGGVQDDTAPLLAALTADLAPLLAAFNQMRAHEGAALEAVIEGQLAQVAALVAEAETLLAARSDAQRDNLASALARVIENTDGLDPVRLEQELALIAVKTDVREELDRLTAHVAQARTLLAEKGPSGRKLDFLMQEFNREANTLCSKAQFAELTRIGLDLKALIDQMREQVQNVE